MIAAFLLSSKPGLRGFSLNLQKNVQTDRAMALGKTVDTRVDGIPGNFF